MFSFAQFFGILVIITNVLAMQMRKKCQIILMLILVNLLSSINFIMLQSYSGAIVCFFAIAQTIINKKFENKNQQVPKKIILIYILISIVLGLFVFTKWIDVLPIVCAILYIFAIVQNKEKNIRKLSLINVIIWLSYDLISQAYAIFISDFLTLISILVGMYRFDFKKKK